MCKALGLILSTKEGRGRGRGKRKTMIKFELLILRDYCDYINIYDAIHIIYYYKSC